MNNILTGHEPADENASNPVAESAGAPTADSEADTDTGNGVDAAAVDALADRLMNNGMRIVARDDEAGVLTVGKLRDTYRVRPGQVIEGEGRFRQHLEQLVDGENNADRE